MIGDRWVESRGDPLIEVRCAWSSQLAGTAVALEPGGSTFVSFHAPESETHTEVAQQVDSAYRASLHGNRGQEEVFESARSFGSLRAEVLAAQVGELAGEYRAALAFIGFDLGSIGFDSTVLDDLLPLFVVACLDPHDEHRWALDHVQSVAPAQYGERLASSGGGPSSPGGGAPSPLGWGGPPPGPGAGSGAGASSPSGRPSVPAPLPVRSVPDDSPCTWRTAGRGLQRQRRGSPSPRRSRRN